MVYLAKRGRSRYLLSVEVEIIKDGNVIPAKVVYVRNRNNRKDYLCLLSTDLSNVIPYPMMLSLESRESNDIRSLGELFVYISDEMADITWLQALQMLLQLFRSTLSETAELTEEKINELVDNFLDTLPSLLKSLLCAA